MPGKSVSAEITRHDENCSRKLKMREAEFGKASRSSCRTRGLLSDVPLDGDLGCRTRLTVRIGSRGAMIGPSESFCLGVRPEEG